MYRAQRNGEKQAELREAMRRLDELNHQEYMELVGGKPGKDSQLAGGEMKARKGVGNWHESDTLRIMALRYNYSVKGEWDGPADRAIVVGREHTVAFPRSLSAPHIQDLADFIEFSKGDPEVVESLRAQAANALVTGDVTELHVDTISSQYDVEAENRAHRRGYTYFFFDPETNDINASPAPGVELENASDQKEKAKAS